VLTVEIIVLGEFIEVSDPKSDMDLDIWGQCAVHVGVEIPIKKVGTKHL